MALGKFKPLNKVYEKGSVFLGMLVSVAVVAVLMMETGVLWSTMMRREREAQLLAQGQEIRKAIGTYYSVHNVYPKKLEDLILDSRLPVTKRYVRRLYKDPIDPHLEWGVINGPGETIMGIYSQAKGQPLKQANFPAGSEDFEGQASYKGWIFLYRPGQSNPP